MTSTDWHYTEIQKKISKVLPVKIGVENFFQAPTCQHTNSIMQLTSKFLWKINKHTCVYACAHTCLHLTLNKMCINCSVTRTVNLLTNSSWTPESIYIETRKLCLLHCMWQTILPANGLQLLTLLLWRFQVPFKVIKHISGHPEAYSLPHSLGFITLTEKLLRPCQVNDLKIELWQQEIRTIISESSNLLSSLPVSKRSVPNTQQKEGTLLEKVCVNTAFWDICLVWVCSCLEFDSATVITVSRISCSHSFTHYSRDQNTDPKKWKCHKDQISHKPPGRVISTRKEGRYAWRGCQQQCTTIESWQHKQICGHQGVN